MEKRSKAIDRGNKPIVKGYLYNARPFMLYLYIFGIASVVVFFFLAILEGPRLYVRYSLIISFILLFVVPLLIKNYKNNGEINFLYNKINLIYYNGNNKSFNLENMEEVVIKYSNCWLQTEFSLGYGFHINDGTENSISFTYEGKRKEIFFQVRSRQFIERVYNLWKHRTSPSIKLIHDATPPKVKWTNKSEQNDRRF